MTIPGLFSIIHPLWLLSIPIATALLVYVYRKRGRGTRVVVATNFILQKLPRELRSRSSFLPPPRFFFECLLAILIGLLLAGIEQEQETKNIAILVDNSYHTRALFSNETRLARIIQKAQASISSFPRDATVTLFSTAPFPTQIGESYLSTTEAWNTLESVRWVEATGNLQSAAEFIAKQQTFESLYIFSDAMPAVDYRPQKSIYYFPLNEVGPENNFAIRELAWIKNTASESSLQLRVSIVSYSNKDTVATVHLQCMDPQNRIETIETKELSIKAGTSIDLTFTAIPEQSKACKSTIHLPENTQSIDALPEDNTRWIINNNESDSIILVSEFPVEALKLDTISHYTFEHQHPARYFQQAPEQQRRYKAAIFHRINALKQPETNALFIAPEETLAFANTELQENAELTRWDAGHPIVRYVNFSTINLTRARSFSSSLELYPVVYANKGSLILAGESENNRILVTGFELLPFEGKTQPTLSILFLNMLKWITENKESSSALTTFQTLPVTDNSSLRYVDAPNIDAKIVMAAEESVQARYAGLLEHTDGTTDTLYAVTFFEEQESDLRTVRSFSPPEFNSQSAPTIDEHLSRTFLWIVIILLLLDLIWIGFQSLWRNK